MNEANLVRQGSRVFEARLPGGWKQRIRRLEEGARDRPDAILDITGPDGSKTSVVVEVKTHLVPRAVDDLKAQLERYSTNPGLVIATFLSARTRERLRAANLNFLDLTGNVWFVLSRPGLYIETQGAQQDPSPGPRQGRSLRGAKAGRIVRALCDFSVPLPISDLAVKAKVDISYASRLVEWLSREALLERRHRGSVQTVDKGALLRRWAEDYQVLTSNDGSGYLDPRGIDAFIRRLAEGALRVRYALTGSVVANRVAPVAPARLAMLYVDEPERAASGLKLQPTETGTNVMLLAPFDDVVFERTWKDDGLTLVAPSQAAVDLLTSPGRAPSEAEAILDKLAREVP
jgi:hypothetical protein